MPVLERHPLFQLVWAMPATQVAAKYGISSNALGKICAAMHVPTPPRGYWAKVLAGQSPKQGALSPDGPDMLLTWEVDEIGSLRQKEAAAERAAEVLQRSKRVVLPLKKSWGDLHPLISATKLFQREGHRPGFSSSRPWLRSLPVNVPPHKFKRALLFLENLVLHAESRGIQFRCDADLEGYSGKNEPQDFLYWFSIRGRRSRFHLSEVRLKGESLLSFNLNLDQFKNPRVWKDDKFSLIEERIDEILFEVEAEVAHLEAAEQKREQRRLIEAPLAAERLEQERRERAEKERRQETRRREERAVETFNEAADRSARARVLELYVAGVRSKAVADCTLEEPGAREWFEWADALISRMRSVEDRPWMFTAFQYHLPSLLGSGECRRG